MRNVGLLLLNACLLLPAVWTASAQSAGASNDSTTQPTTRQLAISIGAPRGDWVKDPRYGPTLVTLHRRGSLQEVLTELAKAADIRIIPDRDLGDRFQNASKREASIDADQQPLMAVLYEVCAQNGLEIRRSGDEIAASGPSPSTRPAGAPSVELGLRTGDRGIGRVVVSGPLACELVRIRHHVSGEETDNSVALVLSIFVEPKLRVVQDRVMLESAVDNNGNVMRQTSDANARYYGANIGIAGGRTLIMSAPQTNAGKRLEPVRIKWSFLVQRQSERIEIPLPMAAAERREVGGMKLEVAPGGTDTNTGIKDTFRFTLERNQRSSFDWPDLKAAAQGMGPVLLDSGGRALERADVNTRISNDDDDTLSWRVEWLSGSRATKREAKRLILNFPVDAKHIEIPTVFEDLPLP